MKEKLKTNDKNLLEVIKGGGVTFLFYGFNLVFVYLIATFISKNYGAEVYGRYSIIKSLILILIIFGTLGLNTLAIKLSSNNEFYEKGYYKKDYLRKSYFIILICSLFISLVIFLGSEFFSKEVFGDELLSKYFKLFPILFISAVFLNYNSNMFKGQGKVLLFAITSSFLTNFLFLISLFSCFYFFSRTENTLINIFLASFLVTLIISIRYMFPIRIHNNFKKIQLRQLLSNSVPMMISSSMIFVIFSVDILMLGFFDSSKNVGIYKIIVQIASLNTVFVIVFGTVIGPRISTFFNEGKLDNLNSLLYKTLKMIFYLTLPILLATLLFSESILQFFGEDYLKGKTALIILTSTQFLFALSGFVDLTLNMTGNQKIFGKITIVTAVINLLLNYLLIPKLGITGAAIATSFSIFATNLIGVLFITKKLKLQSIYIPGIKIFKK